MEADLRIGNKSGLRQELEDKLKLPVVETRAGKVFVLESFGRDAKVLPEGYLSRPMVLKDTGWGRKSSVKRRFFPIRLFVRYPEVSAKSADTALKRLTSAGKRPKSIHITIDTGPTPADWNGLQKFASTILNAVGKSGMPPGIIIEGAFFKPGGEVMNWLAKRRVVPRFILGSALGYPSELNGEMAKVLTAMSGYGLRAPVLFYWSGESCAVVAKVLKKALQLNKFAGVGILPHFLSPRFDCAIGRIDTTAKKFSELLECLSADRQFSEFLEEPVSDIEERLTDSPRARCARAVITGKGEIVPFRMFPFAARGPSLEKSGRPMRSPAWFFSVPMHGRCGRCVWRRICGGIDRSPTEFRGQYEIIADEWCLYRKVFMRRIVGECLEIREHLNNIRDNLLKDAS